MISDDDVEALLKRKTKSEIIDNLKSWKFKLKESASKEQLIADVIKNVYSTEAFSKKFESARGGSGGYIAYVCIHGGVYAMKTLIKHEAPSDYVDVYLGFKRKPTFVICDMPDRIAKHLNARNGQLLRKYFGMLLPPYPENFKKANAGEISLSLNSVLEKEPDCFDDTDANESKSYILHDNFHKHNTKK